jgi:ribose 5-phosphate isomerase B
MKPLLFACDHAAVDLKKTLMREAEKQGYTPIDLGAHDATSVDYPDYAHALADAIKAGKAERGVLLCGSGIGMSIAANRHAHIRAALCSQALMAKLSRQHNDANVLVLGARLIGEAVAMECLEVFLATAFEGGRHQGRVEKI